MVNLLISLILALTGIERTVDPDMTAEAERRVEMIQTDFSHNGLTTWEVLAWNTHAEGETATRRAAEQWRESPTHWEILTDPSLTRIGCAVDQAGDAWYFVCAFAQEVVIQASEPEPKPTLPAPTPAPVPVAPIPTQPPVVTLPDTAVGT